MGLYGPHVESPGSSPSRAFITHFRPLSAARYGKHKHGRNLFSSLLDYGSARADCGLSSLRELPEDPLPSLPLPASVARLSRPILSSLAALPVFRKLQGQNCSIDIVAFHNGLRALPTNPLSELRVLPIWYNQGAVSHVTYAGLRNLLQYLTWS